MGKKKFKSILLFICGIFLFSVLILNCEHVTNLANIDYPYESAYKCILHIPFGF